MQEFRLKLSDAASRPIPLTFRHLVRHIKELRPETIIGWQPAGRAYAAAAPASGQTKISGRVANRRKRT